MNHDTAIPGSVRIFGIDCATDPRRIGLASAWWDGDRACVTEMTAAGGDVLPDIWLAERIHSLRNQDYAAGGCSVLLALDAPLGWPQAFGAELAGHNAGAPINTQPVNFFRRETDRYIARTVGRRPLDVGAERIARTALSALQLLSRLSHRLGEPVPVVWQPHFPTGLGALEVYPAGVLQVLGLPASGYKAREDAAVRERILYGLLEHMILPQDVTPAKKDADVLDALVCVLAGADFLAGRAMPPEDEQLAQKEGWIWVRRPM